MYERVTGRHLSETPSVRALHHPSRRSLSALASLALLHNLSVHYNNYSL